MSMVRNVYTRVLFFALLLLSGICTNAQPLKGPPPIPNYICDSSSFYADYFPNMSIDYAKKELSINVYNGNKQHVDCRVSIDYYSTPVIAIQPQTLSFPLIDVNSTTTFVFAIDSLINPDSLDRSTIYITLHIQSTTDLMDCSASFATYYGTKPHFPPYEMCDYLSLDTVTVSDTEIALYIRNSSNYTVLSPQLYTFKKLKEMNFDKDSTYTGLYLDTVGGINNGVTRLSLPVYYLKDKDSLPSNNKFNFLFYLADSTNTIFRCPLEYNIRHGQELITINAELPKQGRVYSISNKGQLRLMGDVEGSTISIYNITGQLLHQQVSSGEQPVISIGQLAPGMYFATVERKGERLLTKFIR